MKASMYARSPKVRKKREKALLYKSESPEFSSLQSAERTYPQVYGV